MPWRQSRMGLKVNRIENETAGLKSKMRSKLMKFDWLWHPGDRCRVLFPRSYSILSRYKSLCLTEECQSSVHEIICRILFFSVKMPTGLRVAFGVIGTFAILNNALLLVVILKNRSMLKTPYNTLVLSLAITDFITGKYNNMFVVFVLSVLSLCCVFCIGRK